MSHRQLNEKRKNAFHIAISAGIAILIVICSYVFRDTTPVDYPSENPDNGVVTTYLDIQKPTC